MISPLELWHSLGVREGGRYLVHSNLALFFDEKYVRNALGLLESLVEAVGKEGNVVLPAFTYSKFPNPPFDQNSDFGLDKMGALSVAGLNLGFQRTRDPMFSLLYSNSLLDDLEPSADKSFGNGSTFGTLVDLDYHVISLGVGAGSTIIHELERRLNVLYRSDTWIRVVTRVSGESTVIPWRIYARNVQDSATTADFSKLTRQARHLPFVTKVKGRHAFGYHYSMTDMFIHLKSELRTNSDFLIRGREC